VRVIRAEQRFRTERADGTTWHSYSAGAHYDPTNTHFGPLIALDEHVVNPAGGFAAHRHTGVELVSYVLEGTLRHTSDGTSVAVEAGSLSHQGAGVGLVHAEVNDSSRERLRFVQMWLTGAARATSHTVISAADGLQVAVHEAHHETWCPVLARLSVLVLAAGQRLELPQGQMQVFVVAGGCELAGVALRTSDSARLEMTDDRDVVALEPGELLVWQFTRP
jgi:redox-sensitive bicupin YhaK (pirin superfamily)